MFHVKYIVAVIGLVFLSAAPAAAQMGNSTMSMPQGSTKPMAKDQMGSSKMEHGNMGMSKTSMVSMKRCHKMSHRAMMRSKHCAAMMKTHHDMMHSGKMAQ